MISITIVPLGRVKCRFRVRQFAWQRSSTILTDRVLQTCESLLTQHRQKGKEDLVICVYVATSEKFVRRKKQQVLVRVGKFARSFVGVTSLRRIARLFAQQDLGPQRST